MDEPTMRIGEVARRTGLPPATIRAWQRRYGLLAPSRSDGGQRLYGEADVRALDEVGALVADGWALALAAEHVARERGANSESGEVPGPPARLTGSAPPAARPVTRPQPAGWDDGASQTQARATDVIVLPDEGWSARTDEAALVAAHRATRAMLRAESPAAVVAAVVDLVVELGGDIVPAAHVGADVLPVDLGLGETDPVLARAEPFSVTRLRLEAVLPGVIEDARHMAATLRQAGMAGSTPVDDEPPRPH